MVIHLRKYESGEYGLAEAVSEIKELRQQRRIRDKHIEELVQASNKIIKDNIHRHMMAALYVNISSYSAVKISINIKIQRCVL